MLWWEDGYDRYQFKGLDLHTRYARISAPVANFVKGVDFAGFRPVAVSHSEELKGGAVGNDRIVLAWFRDAQCVPPACPTRRIVGQEVTLDLIGQGRDRLVEFYDTGTAKTLGRTSAQAKGDRIILTLPPFEDSIALKVFARYP
jgi:hypothetical protein